MALDQVDSARLEFLRTQGTLNQTEVEEVIKLVLLQAEPVKTPAEVKAEAAEEKAEEEAKAKEATEVVAKTAETAAKASTAKHV